MAYHTCTATLSSYMHKHALTLVDFTGYRSGRVCDVCSQPLKELVYQCKACGFDVHPLCTQIPRKLKHALHPNHQLFLTTKSCADCRGACTSWRYSCKSCGFHIHPQCALKNLNHSNSNTIIRVASVTGAPQDNPIRQQITFPTNASLSSDMHKHTLSLVDFTGCRSGHVCDVCSQQANELVYQCKPCRFDVHPHCTLIPRKLKHALHPNHQLVLQPSTSKSCVSCRGACTHWEYSCKSCGFHIHPECALKNLNHSNSKIGILPATTLTPERVHRELPPGYFSATSSPKDNQMGHQITCPTGVARKLTPQPIQAEVPRGYASLMSATQDNPTGNQITCSTSDAATPTPQPVKAEVPHGYASVTIAPKDNPIRHQITCPTKTTLSSYMHKHILTLKDYTGCRSSRVCDVCSQKVNELVYQCKACEFDVHPLCTQFPKQLKHALHPNHPLVLQSSTTKPCAVCRGACTRWRYSCKSCDFHIHPNCVLQNSHHSNSNSNTNIRATTTLTPQLVQAEVPQGCRMTSAPQDYFNYFAPNMQYEFTNYHVPHYYHSQYSNSGSYSVQGSGGNTDNSFGFGGKSMYDIVQDLAAGVISNVIFGALFN